MSGQEKDRAILFGMVFGFGLGAFWTTIACMLMVRMMHGG